MTVLSNSFFCVVVFAMGFVGCSSATLSPNAIQNSQVSFDQAIDALHSKDYAGALLLLNEAIAPGGLSADDSAEAYLQRGICNLELGNLDEGFADIERAEPGVGDMSRIHMAKHSYWTKQSNPSKAQEELAAANSVREGL